MAGGKGTRIQSVASDIPKPMIRILGKPILEHQIECLKSNGITDITLVTGHLGHFINEYFGDGSKFGVNIKYYNETSPLGTAGALYKIEGLDEDFLLLCGDTIFDIDINRFAKFHKEHGAYASLMAHPNSHPYDSSLLVTETIFPGQEGNSDLGALPLETCRVVRWLNKEENATIEHEKENLWFKNLVNAGIEIISPELLREAKKHLSKEKIDLDRDILKPAVSSGRIFAYRSSEYIKDMGTPDRYYQVEKDLKSGLVASRNLREKQKAVFLDRDGTINKSAGFLCSLKDMILLEGAAEAIKAINNAGYLAVVITNQPQIARGEISFEDLDRINSKMETLLGKEGAYLDALYFCPHHTDKGFAGERLEYKCQCSCRKPKPGLLLQAAKDLNIDLTSSIMIGDSNRDIEAGKNAGCAKTLLVKEDFSLLDAVKTCL